MPMYQQSFPSINNILIDLIDPAQFWSTIGPTTQGCLGMLLSKTPYAETVQGTSLVWAACLPADVPCAWSPHAHLTKRMFGTFCLVLLKINDHLQWDFTKLMRQVSISRAQACRALLPSPCLLATPINCRPLRAGGNLEDSCLQAFFS